MRLRESNGARDDLARALVLVENVEAVSAGRMVHQVQRRVAGQRFDQRYAMNYRVISNPYAYHLRAAPYGYRWVQSGNDAVLVAITSGIIGAILANQF